VGQHRAVVGLLQDDRHPGRQRAVGHDAHRVDAGRHQLLAAEPAEHVVPHHAGEGHAQTEARHAASKDCGRAAQHQVGAVEQLLGLAPGRLNIAAQDQVGVQLAKHEYVVHVWVLLSPRSHEAAKAIRDAGVHPFREASNGYPNRRSAS
jgi:hypothetical protein